MSRGTSIKNIVHTLRTVRSATIRLDGHEITLEPDIPTSAQAILEEVERSRRDTVVLSDR
ncbi:hypothetical protein K1T35_40960 [Pseudonocardia sp. DSM 110487]|uniref:hypothetical protein n=1 Tax=Pseudonocardia sp. DSM 110487 TaxID=2865833 RepID=UPI001C6A8045|nr:hypothetical protein [Pseudonocardia sp. DSM 110487]QYN34689.1 hypothetical protein K1T35_40960 [Pseudonocardia sp. DSM 110487]